MKYRGLISFFFCTMSFGYEAIVIDPVADLVGAPLADSNMYMNLPYHLEDKIPCKRLHQLLKHERVTVIEEQDDQTKVIICNAYYRTNQSPEHCITYWMHKKSLIPLHALLPADQKKIPSTTIDAKIATVTLVKPWYDSTAQCGYSPGMRFVVAGDVHNGLLPVYVYDNLTHAMIVCMIPCMHLLQDTARSPAVQRTLLCRVLRAWTHQAPKNIPYTWGGVSYIPQSPIKNGFDCSGLVLRAAQCVGIPYYYKNTYTLAQEGTPITQAEQIKNGDLIWIPGHVLVIVDNARGRVIEARGYEHGYGYVHEKSLCDIFKDIQTPADIIAHCNSKKPLFRIDYHGKVRNMYHNFAIYQLLPS